MLSVTVSECAALSLDVYYDVNDPERPALPQGWIRFKDSAHYPNDYFGVCYFKEVNGIPIIVIANRGTVLSAIGTIRADIQIAIEKTLGQFKSVQDFNEKAFTALEKIFSEEKLNNSTLIFTGHSLGAVLADFAVSMGLDSLVAQGGRLKSITFENPGSKPNLISYFRREGGSSPEELNKILARLSMICEAYQGDVNLINTCNKQVGRTFRAIPKPYDYAVWDRGPYVPIDDNYIFNLYYLGYTFDQHKMIKILNHLKSNGHIEQILNPPVGFKNGYIAYLDGETRSEYWRGYATIIWNNRPDIREELSHNFNKYLISFNTQLKLTQQAARERAKSFQYDLSTLNIEELFLSSSAANASDPLLSQRSTIGTNKFTIFSKNSNPENIEEFVLIDKDDQVNDPENKKQHTCIII